MRIGEVLALKREDVDPINGVVKVINGKNGVSRYIPVSDSLKMVSQQYAETIDMSDEDKPFFISSYTGGHLTYDAMKYMFPKMFKAADIYMADGKNTQHPLHSTHVLYQKSGENVGQRNEYPTLPSRYWLPRLAM